MSIMLLVIVLFSKVVWSQGLSPLFISRMRLPEAQVKQQRIPSQPNTKGAVWFGEGM